MLEHFWMLQQLYIYAYSVLDLPESINVKPGGASNFWTVLALWLIFHRKEHKIKDQGRKKNALVIFQSPYQASQVLPGQQKFPVDGVVFSNILIRLKAI